ncbi:MAG: hypothetical protein ACR2HV_04370 [Acidimicrobiales bacterium]
MSPGPEVVVAGGGIAASAAAIRLRRLGFGVRLLVRRGAVPAGVEALPQQALGLLDVLDEPDLVAEAGGVAVSGRRHVERRELARVFLERARGRGAAIEEVHRLPPAASVPHAVAALVDATGRAAAWSRPLFTEGHDVAWQYEGPPQPDPALRVVHAGGWWAYRLGLPSTTWAGVVVTDPAVTRDAGGSIQAVVGQGLKRLDLDPAAMSPRGRRAARVQRAARPVAGRRIAVGDAALAHDPIAGAGIRFALASAIAAATAIATWVDEPGHSDLAAAYYGELVAGEHSRHMEARRAVHAGATEPGPDTHVALLEPAPVPGVLRFTASLVETPLAVDGLIRSGPAVRLPDGTLTRWLGSFDLLVLARLASDPVPRLVLLAQLQQEGLDPGGARAVVSWATRHGLLTGDEEQAS